MAERLERIPVEGDRLSFANYNLEVLEMDGMRVARVRFTHVERSADEQAETDSAGQDQTPE